MSDLEIRNNQKVLNIFKSTRRYFTHDFPFNDQYTVTAKELEVFFLIHDYLTEDFGSKTQNKKRRGFILKEISDYLTEDWVKYYKAFYYRFVLTVFSLFSDFEKFESKEYLRKILLLLRDKVGDYDTISNNSKSLVPLKSPYMMAIIDKYDLVTMRILFDLGMIPYKGYSERIRITDIPFYPISHGHTIVYLLDLTIFQLVLLASATGLEWKLHYYYEDFINIMNNFEKHMSFEEYINIRGRDNIIKVINNYKEIKPFFVPYMDKLMKSSRVHINKYLF